MSEILREGLRLSVMGMSLTFMALGLLVFVMILLERLFGASQATSNDRDVGETPAVSAPAQHEADEEVVAAISAALAHLGVLDTGRQGLGTALEGRRGGWWMMGRVRKRRPGDTLRPRGRGEA